MKFLLTSAGVTNKSIHNTLVEMLEKPIAESNALCIPTAMYGHPWVGPGVNAWEFISGKSENPMVSLGWKSVGVLELTALPSISEDRWVPLVQNTDVLLVAGYLAHWMKQSGLAELLHSLNAVYVGMSAGSMVLAPSIGKDFVGWTPPNGEDHALNLVDFSIFPHLENETLPENTMEAAERWAKGMPGTAFAIDDQTAIKVDSGLVEVISEGKWKQFNP